MALSISRNNIFDIYSIPLVYAEDEKWLDNSWLIEHLRQLALHIEENEIEIYSIGIEIDSQYKCPNLIIKGFENKNK